MFRIVRHAPCFVDVQEIELILNEPQKILYTDSVAAACLGLRGSNGLIFPDRIPHPASNVVLR